MKNKKLSRKTIENAKTLSTYSCSCKIACWCNCWAPGAGADLEHSNENFRSSFETTSISYNANIA